MFVTKKNKGGLTALFYELLPLVLFIFLGISFLKGVPFYKQIIYTKKLAKSGIHDIDKMEGLQFETYLKVLLKKLGYKASVTKGSGDYGADLILFEGKNKIVVQAKRYGFKNTIGVSAIQEVFTAKTYYAADECWVMTNSKFTKQAQNLGEICKVKLIDREKLIDMILKIQPEQTAKEVYETVEPTKRTCKKCKDSMTKKEKELL